MSVRRAVIDKEHAGLRLDLFLTRRLLAGSQREGVSRSAVQKMIGEGQVTVNGRTAKAAIRLKPSDLIEVHLLPPKDAGLAAEALPLDILYEDGDCIVVNKAPGMVVHPAAGRKSGTLVNALLHHCPGLQGIGGERRPGIVHRLDKGTSGVMIVAKHDQAFRHLALQFKERRVYKEYLALVWGKFDRDKGVINRAIGRHRSDRKRMSSIRYRSRSREAVTEWQVEGSFRAGPPGSRFSTVTLLRLRPYTGRTHQIRVHLADQEHPVVGDPIYGWKRQGLGRDHVEAAGLADFPRQALHAEKIRFSHPGTGATLEFQAPLFPDMKRLLDGLWEGQRARNQKERKGAEG